MALTDEQIAGYAAGAGFSGRGLAMAVAVALAESGGNPQAHNGNAATGDNSYGLWQINMLGALGPERRQRYGLSSNDELFNPATNAKVAYAMSSHGANWVPWSTYKTGSYLRFMTRGTAAAGKPANVNVDDGGLPWFPWQDPDFGSPTIPNPLEPLNKIVKFVTDPNNYIRLGLFAAGVLLIGIALWKLTDAGGKVKELATIVDKVKPL